MLIFCDGSRQHGGQDRALLSFDLEAGFINQYSICISALMSRMTAIDLRPAFHWNLKQLFVFVLAEYESKANVCFYSLLCI